MSKKYRTVLIIVILLLVIAIVYFVLARDKKPVSINTENPATSTLDEEESEQEPGANLPVTLSITSPEGETFQPRQARMWEAKLENFKDEYGVLAQCKWQFFLNENNEEVLYKEQDGTAVLSTGGLNSCAFTSTLIEKRGKLRAVITITDAAGKINYTAERNYIVQ